MLSRLYDGQSAVVRGEVSSRSFKIERGVKQGDPISALLFIAVMEACLRKLKIKWITLNGARSRHGYGMHIDRLDEPLRKLR